MERDLVLLVVQFDALGSLHQHLPESNLKTQEEARLLPKPPWTRAKMSPGVFERVSWVIVGARMTVERLEGTFKLSQNKGEADRVGALLALGADPIADLMRQTATPAP